MMKATYVAPRRTPFTPLELAQAYELALGGDGKVSAGHIAVLMAHCALETGRDVKRGLIGPSCWLYNLGNVKAGNDYAGKFTCILLNEYLNRDGQRRLFWFAPEGELAAGPGSAIVGPHCPVPDGHPQTRMRAFDSLEVGVANKIVFLTQPRFRYAWERAKAGDPAGYVDAIRAQAYFTANPEPYKAGVISLCRTYLPVAQQIAAEPLRLDPSEEQHIDECISACAKSHESFVPYFDLSQTWQEASTRDRDREILESNT